MEINSENLKKLIVLRFGSLQKCAEVMMITPSTLSRNLSRPSKKFIEKLKRVGVPMPDENHNINTKKITAFISKDGVEGFVVKDNSEGYNLIMKLQEEIKTLKAENYDLKKQLDEAKK